MKLPSPRTNGPRRVFSQCPSSGLFGNLEHNCSVEAASCFKNIHPTSAHRHSRFLSKNAFGRRRLRLTLGVVALERAITGAAGKVKGEKGNLAIPTALHKHWGAWHGAWLALAHPLVLGIGVHGIPSLCSASSGHFPKP